MPTSFGHHNNRSKDARVRKDEHRIKVNKTTLEKEKGNIVLKNFDDETVNREIQKIRSKARTELRKTFLLILLSIIIASFIFYLLGIHFSWF